MLESAGCLEGARALQPGAEVGAAKELHCKSVKASAQWACRGELARSVGLLLLRDRQR
jgi:hypothetical protein